jgi:hypothetical protein
MAISITAHVNGFFTTSNGTIFYDNFGILLCLFLVANEDAVQKNQAKNDCDQTN